MRRIVGISARSAVAVGLPLAGAIYLGAEARETVMRRYSEGMFSWQPPARIETATQNSPQTFEQAENADLGSGDQRAESAGTGAGAVPRQPRGQTASQAENEVAAEQQASEIPAEEPPPTKAVDAHARHIVISIPDRRLALLEDGRLLKIYPVAVGKEETPSPQGEFTVINHAVNPTYRHEGKKIGPGRNNPLGTRWMGLSAKGYGIHGTNMQSSVGKVASHGCFRMRKEDVEELYRRVRVGDVVSIRGERDEITANLFSANAADKTATEVAAAGSVSPASADQ